MYLYVSKANISIKKERGYKTWGKQTNEDTRITATHSSYWLYPSLRTACQFSRWPQ